MNEHQKLAIRALEKIRNEDDWGDNVGLAQIEAAINWIEQQDDDDDELPDFIPNQPASAMYDSSIQAITEGKNHRAILLKPGYVFDRRHSAADVLSHEFDGYQKGGVPASFKPVNETTIGLDRIQFESIKGDVASCVVLNEAGLILWLACVNHGTGGDLTIISNQEE